MSHPKQVVVAIKRLPHSEGLPLPDYQSALATGADLFAAIGKREKVWIHPGDTKVIPTGIAVALPEWWELQCRSRSGLAARESLAVINSPGTIDADYRGEILVALNNHGRESRTIQRGDRIAQLVLAPVYVIEWNEVEELPASARGAGGFGSTGRGIK